MRGRLQDGGLLLTPDVGLQQLLPPSARDGCVKVALQLGGSKAPRAGTSQA